MTSIIGYARRLRKTEPNPAQYLEAVDTIYHESCRLENLSKKLMQLMLLDQEPLQKERVPITRLFDSIGKTLPQVSAGIDISFRATQDQSVYADRTLLDDLLRNLILNAVRACGENGKIRVSAETRPPLIRFNVSDNGTGIPADEIEKITEPFYKVDRSRTSLGDGSGLGLSICQKIANLHDTSLALHSVQDEGLSVSFEIAEYKEESSHA
jgi:signal transduction histidine kinase